VQTSPTKVLLPTTLRPLVGPLSDSLAQGVRLSPPCLHAEPTPQKRATCEGELNALLRAGGRRIRVGVYLLGSPSPLARRPRVCHGRAGSSDVARHISALARHSLAPWAWGGGSRDAGSRRPCQTSLGTAWWHRRRWSHPDVSRARWVVGRLCAQPVQLMGAWAPKGQWAGPALRKGLASLSAGLALPRHGSQVAPVGYGLEQARAS
jgi:hypothetical protein